MVTSENKIRATRIWSKCIAIPNCSKAMVTGPGAGQTKIGGHSTVDKGLPAVAVRCKLPHLRVAKDIYDRCANISN